MGGEDVCVCVCSCVRCSDAAISCAAEQLCSLTQNHAGRIQGLPSHYLHAQAAFVTFCLSSCLKMEEFSLSLSPLSE